MGIKQMVSPAFGLVPSVTWNTVTNQAGVAAGRKSVTLTSTDHAGYYRLALE